MARLTSERAIERIGELRALPDSEALRRELAGLLAAAPAAGVAAAAVLVAERELRALEAELAASFARFLEQPLKRDPQCVAKRAIARALLGLGASALDAYRAGSRHVQLEPVLGGKVDTAAELRALCAQGLVLARAADLWPALADLLADAEPAARAGAVRAIALAGNAYIGAPLLRLKIRCGDSDGRVMADALSALLQIDRDASLELVAEHLDHADGAVAEGAALALGESHAPGALAHLQSWLQRVIDADLRRTGYLAVALLRSDPALDFLLAELRSATPHSARHALSALAIHRADTSLRARVERSLAECGEDALRETFRDAFLQ